MIAFTQYLMPDGRQREQWIERPGEIADEANSLIKRGVRFEAEMLPDGAISLEAVIDNKDGDAVSLAGELCSNGPEVPLAVDRLVRAAGESMRRRAAKRGGQ